MDELAKAGPGKAWDQGAKKYALKTAQNGYFTQFYQEITRNFCVIFIE